MKVRKIVSSILLTSILSLNILAENNDLYISDAYTKIGSTQNINSQELVAEEIIRAQSNFRKQLKADKLSWGQACCFFDSHGKDPSLQIVKPYISEIVKLKCGTIEKADQETIIRKVKAAKDLENLIPISYTMQDFGGITTIEKKYEGERENLGSKLLAKALLAQSKYEGSVLIDEYKAGYPMFWVVKNVEELRAISNYMLNKFNEEGFNITDPSEKVILTLKIENDPKLKTLSKLDKEFIQTYFELFPLTDADINAFFEKNKDIIVQRNLDLKSANPKYLGESYLESVVRQLDSEYKKFSVKEWAIFATVLFAGSFALDEVKAGINELKKQVTPDKSGSFLGCLVRWLFKKKPADAKPAATPSTTPAS